MSETRQVQFVRDPQALASLVSRLSGAPRIALDTEFMRERTYYARLCLVQLATDELMAVVDPLACDDLSSLWQVITDGPEVVFHAASQDLEIIAGECGRAPSRHFDTQVAAAFVGYGDSIGYSKLVERVTGQGTGRSEAYTDWARRPLRQEQIDYAIDDVRYLLQVADQLVSELHEAGRADWVRQELDAIADQVEAEPKPERMWRKVKGSRKLRGQKLGVLRELAAWREREAQRRDIPRQRVVADHVLAEVARRTPRKTAQLERLRGLHAGEVRRSGEALLAAVQRGLEIPEEDLPDWGSAPRRLADPRVDMFAALLDSVLRGAAANLRLSSRIMANRKDLEALARHRLDGGPLPSLPVLEGWRRACVGERLLSVLSGELAPIVAEGEDGPVLDLLDVPGR